MITLKPIERVEWDELIKQFPEANFLQSWQWGNLQEQLGHTTLRYQIIQDDKSIGLVSGVVKSARRGRYLEIAGGPLINWNNTAIINEVLSTLQALGKANDCVFVRIRPQCLDTPLLRKTFARFGAKLSPMHVTADHTTIVNLTLDNETLLTNMRQQTRYEIKRAVRREVVVTQVDTPEIIDTFYSLQAETAARQGFVAPSKKYLSGLMQAFEANASIYQATKNGQLLNLALVVNYGKEAAYLEAASSPEARREPGAYAVLWQAMQDAKVRGIERFNLWGIAPPDSPKHRYAGVTTFKHGFGGESVAYLAPYDLVIKPASYQLTKLIETVRKKRRHL